MMMPLYNLIADGPINGFLHNYLLVYEVKTIKTNTPLKNQTNQESQVLLNLLRRY